MSGARAGDIRRPVRWAQYAAVLLVGVLGCVPGWPAWEDGSSARSVDAAFAEGAPSRAQIVSARDAWEGERAGSGTVHVLDPYLSRRILAPWRGSPAFDSAWGAIRTRRIPIMIATGSELVPALPVALADAPSCYGYLMPFPMSRRGAPLKRALVLVRVDYAARFAQHYFPTVALDATGPYAPWVDDVLAHEIYGHLLPLRDAGIVTVACDNRHPRDPVGVVSCVDRRALLIRQQMLQSTGPRTAGY
jgi:hypothetical protein